MIIEKMENGIYQAIDEENGRVLVTVTALGNNEYKAINQNVSIMAEIIPIDDYRTQVQCISCKVPGKNGKLHKAGQSDTQHFTSWLHYMLEEKGFIRKTIAR